MAAQLRLVDTPAPTNDNVPPWAGFVYAPPAPPQSLVARIFALRFSPAPLQRLRCVLVVWRMLP